MNEIIVLERQKETARVKLQLSHISISHIHPHVVCLGPDPKKYMNMWVILSTGEILSCLQWKLKVMNTSASQATC